MKFSDSILILLCASLPAFAQSGPPMPLMRAVVHPKIAVTNPASASMIISPSTVPQPDTNIWLLTDGRGDWTVLLPPNINGSNYLGTLDCSTDLVHWTQGDVAKFDYVCISNTLHFRTDPCVPYKFVRLHLMTNTMNNYYPGGLNP